jgi:uncharacterized membrane protein (GlpM family)
VKQKVKEAIGRFVFGGVVTLTTGVIAKRFGPEVGGLFLAFPAILPASLTLVKKHEGRERAATDARGSCWGAFGMLAFGATIWLVPERVHFALVLLVAALAWLGVAALVWLVAERASS